MYKEDCKNMLKIVIACAVDARAPSKVNQKQTINCKKASTIFDNIFYYSMHFHRGFF